MAQLELSEYPNVSAPWRPFAIFVYITMAEKSEVDNDGDIDDEEESKRKEEERVSNKVVSVSNTKFKALFECFMAECC